MCERRLVIFLKDLLLLEPDPVECFLITIPVLTVPLGAFNDIAALKPAFLALSELEMLAALANITEAFSSE